MPRRSLLCFLFLLGFSSLAFSSTLPKGLVWKDGGTQPAYTAANAQRGGTLNGSVASFPLTFRLYGPNSNSGGFVRYNRQLSMMGLTQVHPNTRAIIPALAVSWAVLKDNKTVFYKLDPDATWSDGKPLTAADFVFAFKIFQSKDLQAPFYKQYMRDHFEVVEALAPHILKVVAKKPSWRLLYEMDLDPLPKHSFKLSKDWVKKANWKAHVTATPYVIGKFKKGKSVTFKRVKNWWGDKKKRFQGVYNFKKIKLRVVRTPEVQFELFKKGKLSLFAVGDATRWVKQTDFDSIKKGYINKQLIYIDIPAGIRGVMMNTQDPVLKDVRVRQALAHCLDFETINQKFLYQLEQRQHNFFDTHSPYKDPDVRAYPFDLKKAGKLLEQAGYTQFNDEGTRTKDGKPLKVSISTGSTAWLKYLSFYKETARKAGIDLEIRQLDGAALYKSFGTRNYMALVLVYGGGQFPGPRQFLHSENVKPGTNNLFMFGNEEVDQLIETFEYNLDEKKRIQAIFKLEKLLHKQALIVPFWRTDHIRLLWWRDIKGPPGFVSKSGMDMNLLWVDRAEKKALKEAKSSGKALPRLPETADPFHLKK